jgi:hypothetical protein
MPPLLPTKRIAHLGTRKTAKVTFRHHIRGGGAPLNSEKVGRPWIDKFDGIARRWRGNSLEVWKPGEGWMKSVGRRVLSDAEEDEREIEAMVSTLKWRLENPDEPRRP